MAISSFDKVSTTASPSLVKDGVPSPNTSTPRRAQGAEPKVGAKDSAGGADSVTISASTNARLPYQTPASSNGVSVGKGKPAPSAIDGIAGEAPFQGQNTRIGSMRNPGSANRAPGVGASQEEGMEKTGDLLLRMRELAMQSANGTMGAPSEGDPMNAEGTATSPSDVQGKANTVHKSLAPFRGKEFGGVVVASALGVDGANGNTQGSTGGAVSGIASAIQKLGSLREDVGAATGRRMNPHEGSLDTMTSTSMSASTPVTENTRPRLSADDAEGLAKRTGSQLSMQPSLGIHTQANVSPRVALSLLQH